MGRCRKGEKNLGYRSACQTTPTTTADSSKNINVYTNESASENCGAKREMAKAPDTDRRVMVDHGKSIICN